MMATAVPTPVHAGAATPAKPVRLQLWLPLTPLFWLLSPFALVLAPFLWVCVAPSRRPANPYVAAIAFGGLLVSLSGTIVDIDAPGARLFIRIF